MRVCEAEPLIRLVDDDDDLRKALVFLLESEGWNVVGYSSAQKFLISDDSSRPGCLILDYFMPGIDGLELQKRLSQSGYSHPIIFLTAHADLDMAISAFRTGADDLLKKPIDNDQLLKAVAKAVEKDRSGMGGSSVYDERKRYDSLTRREKQVLDLVMSGLMNCHVAERLGLSERTVEVHRANGYRKLGVRTIAELARMMNRIKR